ncbi:Scr1 family TA system antitoxin-like transcriptional regulator [Streptomyces sp. NPDC014724]|uniref:Scr1 family TA system antitoxin-like transcriptional regulator n=1 Tax=unclassified Streptomyces TaxID=2593676 RepID=UPI0036F5D85B
MIAGHKALPRSKKSYPQTPNRWIKAYSQGAHPGMAAGPFQILGFPWPADPGVAYVEHRAGALYLEGAHEIHAHNVAFEHLVALALSPDESAEMVREIAEECA